MQAKTSLKPVGREPISNKKAAKFMREFLADDKRISAGVGPEVLHLLTLLAQDLSGQGKPSSSTATENENINTEVKNELTNE